MCHRAVAIVLEVEVRSIVAVLCVSLLGLGWNSATQRCTLRIVWLYITAKVSSFQGYSITLSTVAHFLPVHCASELKQRWHTIVFRVKYASGNGPSIDIGQCFYRWSGCRICDGDKPRRETIRFEPRSGT